MAAVRGITAPAMAPAHLPQEEAQKDALGPDGGPKCVVSGLLLDVNRVLGETLWTQQNDWTVLRSPPCSSGEDAGPPVTCPVPRPCQCLPL